MFDRYTRDSRTTRGKIPRELRLSVYERDAYTCQSCAHKFALAELTIDHLIPLAAGGLDEITNYATACRQCNERKASMPLGEFAASLNLAVESFPICGDPVLDNPGIPGPIKQIRRRIFDRMRSGDVRITGKSAQKKIELAYRRSLWHTEPGRAITVSAPDLPGHARACLPEIEAITQDGDERLLLMELAKSANTRNLIGTILNAEGTLLVRLRSHRERSNDAALNKRIDQALTRFERELRRTDRTAKNRLPRSGHDDDHE